MYLYIKFSFLIVAWQLKGGIRVDVARPSEGTVNILVENKAENSSFSLQPERKESKQSSSTSQFLEYIS